METNNCSQGQKNIQNIKNMDLKTVSSKLM